MTDKNFFPNYLIICLEEEFSFFNNVRGNCVQNHLAMIITKFNNS